MSGVFSTPVRLFDDSLSLCIANGQLRAVGKVGSGVNTKFSADEGALWSASTNLIPSATIPKLPLYQPYAADGNLVAIVTRESSALYLRVSNDGGASVGSRIKLIGYRADASDRCHVAVTGTDIHVFCGRAGIGADGTKKLYYWNSHDGGATVNPMQILDDETGGESGPGNVSAFGSLVCAGYAKRTSPGFLGVSARNKRSTDRGATWEDSLDISGGSANPQIRPRAHIYGESVMVGWEEPLDNDPNATGANATRSNIVINRSLDGGVNFLGPQAITNVTDAYVSHPEFFIQGPLIHALYRISTDQASNNDYHDQNDILGYCMSQDYGESWGPGVIAVRDPLKEDHPFQILATNNYVHIVSMKARYARASIAMLRNL